MCGLLLINKPEGLTSFSAANKIRKISGERRVGHTGTLDPMATGVLPVLLGRATKLSDYLLKADKCYDARVRLGVTTDTLDITGKVLSSKKVDVKNDEVDAALKHFTGKIKQVPPMFSAIKKDGVRLYRLAREGKQVEIPEREIEVFSIERKSDVDESFEFCISCRVSKGTYIRSLVRDIGEYLGTGAVLTALTRTKTAGFSIENCVSLENLNSENIKDYILPAGDAVKDFPAVTVTPAQAFRFSNGGALDLTRLPKKNFADGDIVRVCFEKDFLGLAGVCVGELKCKCLINPVERM